MSDSDHSGSQESTISGTGLTALASYSPASLQYGNVARGADPTLNATITNGGTGTLTISSKSTTGVFPITGGTCGSTLAGGDSCTITVEFQPTGNGSFEGTLTVKENATSGSQTLSIPLNGSGTGFN